ncbi:hypothetical protein [Phenylobacterium sp.]|uniref:hypothetical protein n=1 Tax=Phenylobacterium sp. TaxID=1871053 RepID=UPI002C289D16|nr:hypothetical protein [Phenylobacterium sp.]HLZ73685.1 hypothetical protein [Phenylobacterium sp.]
MRGLIALGLLAAALGGCATPVERVSWLLGETPQGTLQLMLGVPNSDDLRVLAACRPHSGEIRLTVFGQRGDPPIVELHSGELFKRYGGGGVDYGADSLGGVELQFQLRADDPILARVADTGELKMKLGDRWLNLPNGFAQQHDFLRLCRASD